MWSSKVSISALTAIVVVALSACGFKPMYGKGGDDVYRAEFPRISIAQIEDREGQMLRNELLTLMHPRGQAPKQDYRLSITLQESESGIAVSKSSFSTRANYTIVASIHMNSLIDDKPVFTDSVSLTGSYNVLQSQYATLMAEKDVKERLIRELAKSIVNRVSLRFMALSKNPDMATP